ncbi:uncharacterized protein LOC119338414 isoform X2 [Triticum dicoccoides]|uniref:uncharacterized protein LOC119338414 isoform X2 n=1 Tax=Triticum dicoccoides TaxID=85692 RepID=UPI0018916201|nr:uncharacterized protein LOC119338414 isoform X2 [Triticum dicoccoides]
MADAPCCLVVCWRWKYVLYCDVKVSYCDQGNSMYLCGLFLLLIGVAALKLLEGKEQRIREAKQPKEPENMTPVLCTAISPMASTRTRCKVSFRSLGLLRRGSVLSGTARYSILRCKISDVIINGITNE